ncbi:MAG: hypothetical protein IJM53_04515 [Lachnospiraceae bacterium]|nr:hypothetical protein [Lachnospiraceae bacterium]
MKFKEILQKWVINNIGYKVLALVFAFVLWLVIVNLTDPTVSLTISNIDVEILNEDAVADGSHVYTIESGKVISVTVSGKRSIVSSLKASDFLARADFSELSMTNAAPITVSMTGDKSRYYSQLNVKPRTTSMVISIENIESKRVDVEINITGYAPDNMIMDVLKVSPDKLFVKAPVSILNSIDRAVATVSYAEIEESSDIRVVPVLVNAAGEEVTITDDVTVDYNDVVVQAYISYIKDVTVEAAYTGLPAEGYQFDGLELSFTDTTVKGDSGSIRYLTRIAVPVESIDITDATEDMVFTFDLNEYLPEGVTIYSANSTLTVTAHISEIPETSTEEESGSESESETENGEQQTETTEEGN